MRANRSPFFLVVALLLFIVAGCRKESLTPPGNTKPTIVRLSPAQASSTDTVFASINLTWVTADNEQLDSFRLVEIISGVTTQLVSQSISGKDTTLSYIYQISPFLSPLTAIKLRAYVFDTRGLKDSTDFNLTVDIPRDTTSSKPILTYLNNPAINNNIVYNRQSTLNKPAFDLIQRKNVTLTGSVAAKDIQENTLTTGQFAAEFISPNNAANSKTNVFVVLKPNQFNFDRLTYQSMDQAYNANTQTASTGALQVGDIIILRMNFDPQYAAIRITNIVNDGSAGNNDYITFDYKRSSDL
jgi:hypothetical protein